MVVSSGAVVVGETAVALNSESGPVSGTKLYLFNGDDTNSVTLGDSSVTGETGFVLGPGQSLVLELAYGEVVYAIRTGDADVDALQIMRTGV